MRLYFRTPLTPWRARITSSGWMLLAAPAYAADSGFDPAPLALLLGLTLLACLMVIGMLVQRLRAISRGKASAEADIELQKTIVLKTITHYSRRLESEVGSRTRELVKAHKQILAHEKMVALGVFTAGIAHEINNPSNFISVGAQNAVKQIADFHKYVNDLFDNDTPQEVRDGFDNHFTQLSRSISIIKDGSHRIDHVVRSLRAVHPGIEGQMVPTNLVETLTNVWDLLMPIAKTPILTRTQFDAKPWVDCVVADISQVFIALLSNAVHSIEDALLEKGDSYHGEITLRSASDKDNIYITIADNGVGIAEENIEKIFDPFFTTKEVGRGAGLGLSMSRDVISRHNGSIDVRSQPGQYAAFTITLPLQSNDIT
jgi:two-component system NtrC family sensor kinase